MLRIAVPSDGPLHEPTLLFLHSCGVGVLRTNRRRYTAEIPSLPGVAVHFQRGADIAPKVEEGSADMGIVGQDRFLETRRENGDTVSVIDNLGFGYSELVIGVPDSWIDVTSVADLSDLSLEFREQGRDLRIATKYPRLVERFLLSSGVGFFSMVPSSGTLEASPAIGHADIIADISSTGTTMRENRLKTIHGGSIMASEASLICNKALLSTNSDTLALAKILVERFEAHLEAKKFYSVTANMCGKTSEEVAEHVLKHDDILGLQKPSISKVYTRDRDGLYAVTVIVEKGKLLEAVDCFRQIDGGSIVVSEPDYIFHSECKAVTRLIDIS